jgi:DNA-binding response OmpR family regulator
MGMPGIVLLVGKSLEHFGHVRSLLSAGSVVVLAPTVEAARRWLTESMETRRREERDAATIQVGDLRIDLRAHRAFWRNDPLALTELELQVLAALAEEPGRAWTFRELLERAWGGGAGDTEVVRSAVKRLRRKLASGGVVPEIESVWGLGYRLDVGTSL